MSVKQELDCKLQVFRHTAAVCLHDVNLVLLSSWFMYLLSLCQAKKLADAAAAVTSP